jgi:hypothetical protein
LEHRTLGHSGGSARRLLDLTSNGICCCWGERKGMWVATMASSRYLKGLLRRADLHLSSEIRTTRPRYGYRIRIPQERTGGESGRRAWRPLLSSRCRSAFTRTRPRSFAKGRASSHPVAQLGAAGTLFGAETASGPSGVRPCMSLRADRYRQRAAEAKDRATQAKDPSIKSAFENVAAGWIALAEQVGRIDAEKSPVGHQENNGSVR